MPFYFLSFHFHSFVQVERFPVPKSLSCKKQSNQASNQKGNPVPRRNTKRGLKWSFLPTSAKAAKAFHLLSWRSQTACLPPEKSGHTSTIKRKTHAIFSFENQKRRYTCVFFSRSCPCTCNSWLIIATTLILDGSCRLFVILLPVCATVAETTFNTHREPWGCI